MSQAHMKLSDAMRATDMFLSCGFHQGCAANDCPTCMVIREIRATFAAHSDGVSCPDCGYFPGERRGIVHKSSRKRCK